MVVAAIAVIMLRLAAFAGATAQLAPTDAQPIAVPVHPVGCAGGPVGAPYVVGERVIIPIGKECPGAAFWLRLDDGHGADAGHNTVDPVTWILHPATPDLLLPSWEGVLPGRSEARLVDIEAALNTLDGTIIELPLFDATHGVGDGREVELVAVVPFHLEHAYLARADIACGHGRKETCLIGDFRALPSPSPSATIGPTPSPSPTPVPSGTPAPSGSASPSGSPRPSGTPGPTPTASGSSEPSSSPSSTASGSPSASPSGVATRSPSPSPVGFIEISVPDTIGIPLVRGVINRAVVPVIVRSNVPWTVFVTDPDSGPTHGHMVPIGGERGALAATMTMSVAASPPTSLDAPSPVQLNAGSGDAAFFVGLGQPAGPGDAPGTYVIRLTFTAISGF